MAGPNTGSTGEGINIGNVSSSGVTSITLSGSYLDNRMFTRIDINSDPVEIDAAFERAKVELIQELNKIGL